MTPYAWFYQDQVHYHILHSSHPAIDPQRRRQAAFRRAVTVIDKLGGLSISICYEHIRTATVLLQGAPRSSRVRCSYNIAY